jgi:hypothetical protein
MAHKKQVIALTTVLLMALMGLTPACKKHDAANTNSTARTYRMGFATSAPEPNINEIIQSLSLWPSHADAAIISTEVPWDSLLNGEDAATYVTNNYVYVTSIYRSHNLKLWVYIDPENGLARQRDSDPLTAMGKSIAQPNIQQVYERFVVAMDSILHPDHLGLALETNLIRLVAPDSIYQGVKQAVNTAAARVKAIDTKTPLSVSVQAEVAWGRATTPLGGTSTYAGIAADYTDFPFIQELGISSYPYLSYTNPGDIPLNYYAQLTTGHSTPVFVSEGGWTSANITAYNVQSSNAQQQAYIRRQGQLLTQAKAIGLFQLTYTDLSLGAWPTIDSTELIPFAYLGMVDSNFIAKPVLTTWDSLRNQTLQAGY